MDQPTIEAEFNEQKGEWFVKVTCPDCETVHKRSNASIKRDGYIDCSCGIRIEVSVSGLDTAQRGFDEFGKNHK